MTDIKARLADWRTVHPGDEDEGALYIAARDRIEELEAENARLVRDAKKFAAKLAIKGGNENYPTLWAYEQACAALDKHRARAEAAEAKLATARNVIDRLSREIRALKVTP